MAQLAQRHTVNIYTDSFVSNYLLMRDTSTIAPDMWNIRPFSVKTIWIFFHPPAIRWCPSANRVLALRRTAGRCLPGRFCFCRGDRNSPERRGVADCDSGQPLKTILCELAARQSRNDATAERHRPCPMEISEIFQKPLGIFGRAGANKDG